MAPSSAERAAEYDRRYPETISDAAQKIERMERIESKGRRREGGRRFHTVPELPWKERHGEA